MHILHITPYYAPAYAFGGVVRAVEGLAHALTQRGHTITILTTTALSFTESLPATTLQEDNLTIIRTHNQIPFLRKVNLSTPFGMRPIAQDIMPTVDVVHIHEFRTVENLLVTPIATKHQVPIVLSPHGTLVQTTGRSQLKQAWDQLLSPSVANRIQHTIALTDNELHDCQSLWAQWNTSTDFSVIPNGVNMNDFTQLPDAQIFREKYRLGAAQIILFLGRLHERKGVEILLRAFQQANLPNTKLVFAGPDEGMKSSLEALADERVIFTGYLDAQARLEALAAAALFALPAVGEGLSIAALEALAAGVPILLSAGSKIAGVVDAGAGKIVEPNVDSLTQALTEMLSDPTTLAHMSRAAQQLVQERYTWSRVAAQMERTYMQLHPI